MMKYTTSSTDTVSVEDVVWVWCPCVSGCTEHDEIQLLPWKTELKVLNGQRSKYLQICKCFHSPSLPCMLDVPC